MVEIQTNGLNRTLTDDDRSTLIKLLNRRLQDAGKIELSPTGENRVNIIVPGAKNEEISLLRRLITSVGKLEFRWVHENSDELLRLNIIEAGHEELKRTEKPPDGVPVTQSFLVEKKSARGLTGRNLKKVYLDRDPLGRLFIEFELDTSGSETFSKLTRVNIGRQLAIVLDGRLLSAPIIKTEISGGRAVIEGGSRGFAADEAIELLYALENPLPTPLKIVREESY